jgi:ATP phosphoribosyltransferase
MTRILLGVPSKGRLMEATLRCFDACGHAIIRDGSDRGYRGRIAGLPSIDVAFLSASEIALQLRQRKIDAGITGEDLLRDTVAPSDASISVAVRLGFGPTNVVVAVPECWLDVAAMADLDEVAEQLYAKTGRRLRVATKYKALTRRFFEQHGVAGYRIVESTGATEGAPAAGVADVIVDITTSGATLRANQLRILDDGVILVSCAVLANCDTISHHLEFQKLVAAQQDWLSRST